VFRNNRATDAGEAAVYAGSLCNNVFIGNNFNGNYNDWGILFDWETGANTLVGNQDVVIENSPWADCDGDGVPDPNIITGRGAVLHDVVLGKKVSEAASSDKYQ